MYASTPLFVVLRILLALSMTRGWIVQVGDISTAFLHGVAALAGLVLRPPKEYYTNPNILWGLHKAMYGLEHLAKVLQTSVSNDYSRSPTSTPTAMCTSRSTWTPSCSSANLRRSHVSSRRYRPRCYCDTQALVQQARQSTSLVDESQTKETNLKFHSTTATPTTYYEKPTDSRRHQQLHQEQQLPRPHLNKRSYSTSRNMPNTDAWSESYNGFHTHDLT